MLCVEESPDDIVDADEAIDVECVHVQLADFGEGDDAMAAQLGQVLADGALLDVPGLMPGYVRLDVSDRSRGTISHHGDDAAADR